MAGLYGRLAHCQPVNLEGCCEPTKDASECASVPVIRHLAEILNAYRISMGNPASGVIFHSGAATLWIWTSWLNALSVQPWKQFGWNGMAGMRADAALHRTCMNWARMKKSSSASFVTQSRTLPKSVTSKPSIRQFWLQ